jgi:lantibiotic modifying enzyme
VALAGAPYLFRPGELEASLQSDRPDLELAWHAWRWIESSRVPTDRGVTWPADPSDPSSVGDTLYTHGTGVLPFALELFHSTQDEEVLSSARSGADHLVARLDEVEGAGLYVGLAGVAFVLAETYRASGDGRYADATAKAADLLTQRAHRVGTGVAWPIPGPDGSLEPTDVVSGTAGTGLALLYLADVLERPDLLEIATRAGHRLVELAKPVDGGLTWEMWPGYAREMPNFAHGTAGIAYFLATLAGRTGEPAFLAAAVRGAEYVQCIATVDGDRHLVHHSTPGGEDLYYLSWCHGPVGTARLFHRLHEQTGDAKWDDWVHSGARGIMATGIPEERTEGFWENVSQCCGTAGVGEFFLTQYRMTGSSAYRGYVDRLSSDLRSRSNEEGEGTKWIQAEHRVRPELLVAQTGFMQGAAGVGKYFLHADAMRSRGEGPKVLLPDSPY